MPPALTIREQRRKEMKRRRTLAITGMILGAVILLGALTAPFWTAALRPVGDVITPAFTNIPQPNANSMGDPNAPIKITEFSDFQCPACKLFHDRTFAQLVKEYVETGQVYYTYRSMGLWIGQESVDAIEAAYCAGEQNKFWEYHEVLFANQGAENAGLLTQKRLLAFGEVVPGLEMQAFTECVKDNRFNDAINADRANGDAAQVKGTPSFLITAPGKAPKLIGGAMSIADMKREIDAALAP
ncbi:MAG: hypothetical protein OHK0052_27260 [Anaerolineales bacterium]